MRFKYTAVLIAIASLIVSACEEVDDQAIATPYEKSLADPEPTARNYKLNNLKHKVIMAVIDSGVDYNHPRLANNIHFDLDKEGKPVGFGYDYIGMDKFASPYAARTLDQNYEAPADEREKAAATASKIREASLFASKASRYLVADRAIEQEYSSGSYHGTHVAGLMVYDRPDFGLRAYKVLPQNVVYKDGKRENGDRRALVFENITKAIEQSVKDGARVVNMSLGMAADRPNTEKGETGDYKKQAEVLKAVRKIALANPKTLFVAAAGNDSKWIDGKSRLNFPCGVDAPNFLCVGALNHDGDLASFTNIVINNLNIVFAPGADILSTFPVDMCEEDLLGAFKYPKDYPLSTRKSAEEHYKKLEEKCGKSGGFKRLSGTSMASPLIAHLAGEILAAEPGLTGAEVVARIQAKGDRLESLPFKVMRLKLKKPSWYAKEKIKDSPWTWIDGDFGGEAAEAEESDYFEIFSPVK